MSTLRPLTSEEITRRVKWSLLEKKWVVFAEDGSTIIGRSLLKETAIAHLIAYHTARHALARKGKVNEHIFKSNMHGDIPLTPEGLSAAQRKASDIAEANRKYEGFSDSNVVVLRKPTK